MNTRASFRHPPGPRRRQSGAALLTVLLVLAIASVAAIGITTRDHQQTYRHTVLQEAERARGLHAAAEAVALHLLERLPGYDDMPWDGCVSPPIPLEVEGLTVRARLENLHCRFNINSLGREEDPPVAAFAGLLDRAASDAGHSGARGNTLALAVQDWMDPETDNPSYLGLDPPRRSGNRRLLTASELLSVEGFNRELWEAVAPWVAALPTGDNAIDLDRAPEPVRDAALESATEESQETRYFRLQLVVRIDQREYFQCAILDAPNGRTVLRESTACEP